MLHYLQTPGQSGWTESWIDPPELQRAVRVRHRKVQLAAALQEDHGPDGT